MLKFKALVKSKNEFYTVQKINFLDGEVSMWNKPDNSEIEPTNLVERGFDEIELYQLEKIKKGTPMYKEVDLEGVDG